VYVVHEAFFEHALTAECKRRLNAEFTTVPIGQIEDIWVENDVGEVVLVEGALRARGTTSRSENLPEANPRFVALYWDGRLAADIAGLGKAPRVRASSKSTKEIL